MKWTPKTVPLADLKPAEYNPRRQNKKAKKAFQKNAEEFGNLEPIVVNADGTIIGGHQRYYIAIENGAQEMEVFMPDKPLSQEDEMELNVILNSVTGHTVLDKLLENKLDQATLDELGFREFRLPVVKAPDTAVVEQGKQKNPSVLALFFEVDDIIEVKRVLKKIIKDEDSVDGVATAIMHLESYV
jgi:hypothetical protein